MALCEFRRFCKSDDWMYGEGRPTHYNGYLLKTLPYGGAGPARGKPSGNHKTRRCPLCNKRLKLKAVYCTGGEFLYWEIPDHAVREFQKKSPRRKDKKSGRR